jgi:phosphoribosyl 1,2-cyclic phosphodiesterase
MRLASLGSGSEGNAILVEAGATRVLVDAGFSARDLTRRLQQLAVRPESVRAIIVTHDHGDHARGAGVFSRQHQTAVYMTSRTRDACAPRLGGDVNTVCYEPGRPFMIGGLRIESFLTAHDAAEAVGVALVDEQSGLRLGVATDLGRATVQTRHGLSKADFLVLEANHDEALLQGASYPWSVKQRIASTHGHLSNGAAARLAAELVHPGLAGILLAHLSAECNRPELARRVVWRALSKVGYKGFLGVAKQDEPTAFLDVQALRRRMAPQQLSLFDDSTSSNLRAAAGPSR